jgi:hypothetical protein
VCMRDRIHIGVGVWGQDTRVRMRMTSSIGQGHWAYDMWGWEFVL